MQCPVFSLGWELEATHHANIVPEQVVVGSDGSVHGEGLEYRIRTDYINNRVKNIQGLRKLTSQKSLQVDKSCGFHVHVGFEPENNRMLEAKHVWAAWNVNLAREIEETAFRAVPFERTQSDYCMSWKRNPIDNQGLIKKKYSRDKYSNLRRTWINTSEVFRPGGIGTVENRLMGNTKRFPYLFSWVAFSLMLAESAWKLVDDPSLFYNEIEGLKSVLHTIEYKVKNTEGLPPKEVNDTAKLLGKAVNLKMTSLEQKPVLIPLLNGLYHCERGITRCMGCLDRKEYLERTMIDLGLTYELYVGVRGYIDIRLRQPQAQSRAF